MSATVRDMLRGKSDIYCVGPRETVYDALRLMADRNIGAVLVRSDEQIDGIFSERDYARKVILLGKSSRETPTPVSATEIVTADPSVVAPTMTVPPSGAAASAPTAVAGSPRSRLRACPS